MTTPGRLTRRSLLRGGLVLTGGLATVGAGGLVRPERAAAATVFDTLPPALASVSDTVAGRLDPALQDTFRKCFSNSWTTTMRTAFDGTTYVITGDIAAMWLRDSSAQVRPYLAAATDGTVYDVLAGVCRRQAACILLDAYANAFHAPEDDWGLIFERKYEVDSLAGPLGLAYALWRASGRLDHADATFFQAGQRVIDVWRLEQDHERNSSYGHGGPVAPTGMTWGAYRPSDDDCQYGYLVPSNAMAVVALEALAALADATGRAGLAQDARSLEGDIRAGIEQYGRIDLAGVGNVYAYEVDGLGHHNFQDDANIPSLLSLPYLGYCRTDDEIYQRTRSALLSSANSYYYTGRYASGEGSAHTPPGWVWPLGLTMQALTSNDPDERNHLAHVLHDIDNGTGYMHEGIDPNDPSIYTRPWFAWANSLYSELLMELAGTSVRPYYATAVSAPPPAADPLSLLKSTTASSVEPGDVLVPRNATDGDPYSRWASAQGVDPQWLEVDLGAVHSVNRVRLNWERAFGRSYRVELNSGTDTWTQVYATTSGHEGITDVSFAPTDGRYVRVTGTERGTPWGYSLWEFGVYGR